VNSLKYLIEQFDLVINDGKLNKDVLTSNNNQDTYKFSMAEETWPSIRAINFTPVEFVAPVITDESPAKSLLRAIISSQDNFKNTCKILKDYNLSSNLNWLFTEVRDTYKKHKKHTHLFDAFTQDDTRVVQVYQIRREELMWRPDLALTVSLPPTQSSVNTLGELGMYKRVAVIAVPSHVKEEDVCEFAYAATQNYETSWTNDASIAVLAGEHHGSSSVGDVFVTDTRADVACGFGFKKLEMFFPRDADSVSLENSNDHDGLGL
jgi:hypothetical protein